MQVKVKADSLLAMLPTAHRGKHIDRQADGGREKCVQKQTERMREMDG